MTDLIIKYDHGQMLIHLEEFLSCRKIAKVRKLLKLIERSETPELTEQIQKHIEQKLKGLDDIAKTWATIHVRCKEEVKQTEHELSRWVQLRSGYKKNRDGYKHYHENVKNSRKELKKVKEKMRNSKKEFDDTMRDRTFFEKLLSEVFS